MSYGRAGIWLTIGFLIQSAAAQRVITTIAGADWLFPGDGQPALNAPLSGSDGMDIAVDKKGNYYIADFGNLMVMRVGPDGIVNVIAGNGVNFVSGDGGLAVDAALFLPTAVAVNSSTGDVYIAEYGSRIRKVNPDGIITTFAGTGQDGFGGDNGPAERALLDAPYGLAVDFAGNVYIADTYNNRIRKVTPSGIISTVGGNGQPGSTGDGGKAIAATLYFPTRLTVDSQGNIYFVESISSNIPSRIRKVDIHGTITSVAGGGFDPRDGIPATSAGFIALAVAADPFGNLFILDGVQMGVRKVDTAGIITTIAGGKSVTGFGGDGGPAREAVFHFQIYSSVAADSSGNVYVADNSNLRVRKITPDGNINTVAGNGLYRFSGNGGPAVSATLNAPVSIAGDASGNLYVSEESGNRIRRIAANGVISEYAGNGAQGYSGDGGPAASALLAFPTYMVATSGLLVFSDTFNCSIRYIDSDGIIHTYAGVGQTQGCVSSGDGGPASQASISAPMGVDVDPLGNLYLAENQGNRIRAVLAPPDSRIGTLAGDGNAGFSGDNGPASKAELNHPVGVRYFNGSLYFCDSGNNRVRKIDSSFAITTVAGNGQAGYSGDEGPATSAALDAPQSINFDAAGNMYIADQRNSLIRIVTPGGIIHTFAGSRTAKTQGDGGLATKAGLGAPADIFIDPAGDVLFTDTFFNRVRAVLVNPPSFQASPASLAFTATAGSTSLDQSISVLGSIPGIPFTLASRSSGWLQASPATGGMPADIRVTVDPSKLSAGPYIGSVTINAPNAQPSTQVIQVTLTATAPGAPSLNVKPTSLTYSFVQQTAALSRALTVSNAGGGTLSFTVATATVGGRSWLKANPGSGSVNAFASTTVNITADPSNLVAGTYSGTVTIASSDQSQKIIVPVTMTVTAVKQTILIPQTGLTFFVVQGGGAPPPQFFNILNTGVGLMPYSTLASTLAGGSWPSSFPNNGASDANSNLVPQVRVDINPKGLTGGVYYGTVKVNAPSANNNPQAVSVILNVLPPGSKIGPIVQPTGLIFGGIAGGESPGSQTILVQGTSSSPVAFHSGRVTVDGQNWLTSLPSDANVTESQPVRIVVQPQTAGLAAGVYRGTLTLSFSDGNTRTIAIVLVLAPPGSTISAAREPVAAAAGCIPKMLVPVFTQLSSGFSVPAGFPGQVTVKVVDDCASPMTSGDVVVSFSNGDASLRLISLKDGTWAGTWTPVFPASSVTVTADAETPEGLKGEVKLTGGLQTNSQPPVVGAGAVVNGASFAAAAPLAPGSLVTLFGSKLAQGSASAVSLPLPTELAGSSVVLAGQQAPLLFANDGQVNAVIPYGTTVNTGQQVIVLRGSTLSVPQTVTLAPVAPGIFTHDGSGKGQGTVFVGNSTTLADQAHPVRNGDVVVIYCTGLGEVNPPVPTGSPAPFAPHSIVMNAVGVKIGNVAASVQFAGLTPGLVGVYQVNAVVPAVATGDQVPVVITAAGQQSLPVTIAVR